MRCSKMPIAVFSRSPDHGIFATKSLCDALSRDIKEKYKVIMPWTTIFDGLEVGEYDGVRVIKCSIWDRFIQALSEQPNET